MKALRRISRNFATVITNGEKMKVDLRNSKAIELLRQVFLFNPLAMAIGSELEIEETGKVRASDNFGIPQVGRPAEKGKAMTTAERSKAYRERKKLKEWKAENE